jgi:hypothetical protein
MDDRSTLLSYMAILLRRMEELTGQTAKSRADIQHAQHEAQSLQEQWHRCVRELKRKYPSENADPHPIQP